MSVETETATMLPLHYVLNQGKIFKVGFLLFFNREVLKGGFVQEDDFTLSAKLQSNCQVTNP